MIWDRRKVVLMGVVLLAAVVVVTGVVSRRTGAPPTAPEAGEPVDQVEVTRAEDEVEPRSTPSEKPPSSYPRSEEPTPSTDHAAAPEEEKPLTRSQLLAEGHRLYAEGRYVEALGFFEEAADRGSSDARRWAESCRERVKERQHESAAAARDAADAAAAQAEAERHTDRPDLRPPGAVTSQARSMAHDAVRRQIVVSLGSGQRGERFVSTNVRAVTAQVARYEGGASVWSGTLLVTGVVQIPTVAGAGQVWKDYRYSAQVTKPAGQAPGGQTMTVANVSLAMR